MDPAGFEPQESTYLTKRALRHCATIEVFKM